MASGYLANVSMFFRLGGFRAVYLFWMVFMPVCRQLLRLMMGEMGFDEGGFRVVRLLGGCFGCLLRVLFELCFGPLLSLFSGFVDVVGECCSSECSCICWYMLYLPT